jgi:hypothetical protein
VLGTRGSAKRSSSTGTGKIRWSSARRRPRSWSTAAAAASAPGLCRGWPPPRQRAAASRSPSAWMILAPLALGLGLAAHRPAHASGSSTSFTSTRVTLTPHGSVTPSMICWSCGVDLVAVDEEVVELDLTEDAAQRGLGDLGGGHQVVLDGHHRAHRVDHVEVGDGVHPQGDVVLGDDVLGRDVGGDGLEVDLHHPVDDRDDEEQAGPLAPITRPSRKMTPRSYSLTILMAATAARPPRRARPRGRRGLLRSCLLLLGAARATVVGVGLVRPRGRARRRRHLVPPEPSTRGEAGVGGAHVPPRASHEHLRPPW